MIEILSFDTIEKSKIEKKKRAGKWRPLHTDFVNDKYTVTFVNGTDDPDNSEQAIQGRIKFIAQKELRKKLYDNTINFEELKKYLRG